MRPASLCSSSNLATTLGVTEIASKRYSTLAPIRLNGRTIYESDNTPRRGAAKLSIGTTAPTAGAASAAVDVLAAGSGSDRAPYMWSMNSDDDALENLVSRPWSRGNNCWAVIPDPPRPRGAHKMCANAARAGKLTCAEHADREGLARALERARSREWSTRRR